jgi:hypothetical protein
MVGEEGRRPRVQSALALRLVAEQVLGTAASESIEFLYQNGHDKSWNWGRVGATNAAFLQGGGAHLCQTLF